MRPAVLSGEVTNLAAAVQDGFWERQRTLAQSAYPEGSNADNLDISWEAMAAATPLTLGGYVDAALFDRHVMHKDEPVRREHGKQLLRALDEAGKQPLLLNALLVNADGIRGFKGDYLIQPFPKDLSANSILEAIHGGHHVSLPDATMFGLMGYRALSLWPSDRPGDFEIEEVVRLAPEFLAEAQMTFSVPYLQKEGPASRVYWGEVGMEGHVLGIEDERLALKLDASRLVDANRELNRVNVVLEACGGIGYVRKLAERVYHANIQHMGGIPDLDWDALNTEQVLKFAPLVLEAIEPTPDGQLSLFGQESDPIVPEQVFPGDIDDRVRHAETGEGHVGMKYDDTSQGPGSSGKEPVAPSYPPVVAHQSSVASAQQHPWNDRVAPVNRQDRG
ncbi:hypothetical protein CMO91_06620 [Candidatus Woesearchaeota archaeon]|nr:hypothetical protein [Candidatus Woesearchaeota archaeon]